MAKHSENTTRKINARKTKDLIYHSTIDLINEKGFENVSIADITNRASCGIGTFYGHFKSKNDVMDYCIERYNQVAVEAYEKVKDIVDFEEKLSRFLLEDYRGTEELGKGAIRALYASNIMQSHLKINTDNRDVYHILLEFMEEGIRQGKLDKEIPAQEYVEDIETFLIGMDLEWSCSEENVNIDQYVERKVKRLLRGFLK